MVKYNNKKRCKNTKQFRSFTDVNNYNQFLKDLDNKNTNKTVHKKDEVLNDCKNTNALDIKLIVKENNRMFYESNCNSKNVTGISDWEKFLIAIEGIINPDSFESSDGDKKEGKKDGKKEDEKNVIKERVTIDATINNIGDILSLIEKYPYDKHIEYNINMKSLHNIKKPLTELNNMIGMNSLKENIVDQLLFYIQNLQSSNNDNKNIDFMHTVIYGSPGTGKTEVAKIIGEIFSKMGVLTKGTFKKVTRSDLIAGYLGQTALKTKDVITDALGGVLFIDEAYALGNEEKRDSFAKECIDTLCEALSDHKDKLMVIIAGYETELNDCFFNYNQGLNSRFTWRFKTDDYSGADLYNIFIKKVQDNKWFIAEDSNISVKWFEKNKSHFKFYGRDIETLFAKTKIAHSRRVFCLDESVKKRITLEDLDKGYEIFLKNEDSAKKEKERFKTIISSMYV
jgi:SpoVK/Ycf46/Vps4 family AAA+-type ATPase